MTDQLNSNYDVVVVGGGPAGLNGALMLARARRTVAVIDAGAPRNAPADRVHGLFAREGVPPGELLSRGRDEVRSFGGHIVPGEVTEITRDGDDFLITLADSRTTRARRLLVTSGLVDELPDIPGLRARWGHDVIHCPYCHGWESRDRPIGVLGLGPMAIHLALLFRQWSDDITYIAHTNTPPTPEESEQLAARGIRIVEGEIASVEIADDRITGVRLTTGTVVPREILVAPTRMVARAPFLTPLGLTPIPHPMGAGEHIPTDPTGRTTIPGVWAAGNVTDLSAQVGNSAAAGAMAGAHINADLVTEDTRHAVEAHRVHAQV
ncbi:NAD(P)/FAD-dependent oxidoreductase [Nocardia tengchongensis]|uniref:NAD(P)/FAD-dependent oxidoreductase n=1 Tax=Nocardia tengchongensis TaxID=2055889 RepID=UPI003686E5A7